MTRLDDLLSYEDDHERRSPIRSAVLRMAFAVLVIVTVSWMIWRAVERFGLGLPYVLVLALLVAIYGLTKALAWIKPSPLPATLHTDVRVDRDAPADGDGVRDAVRKWAGKLTYAHDDPRHVARMIQPEMVAIIEERVRLRYGVTRATDPDRVRELVGPVLWTFMTEPVTRRIPANQLAALVAEMEDV